MCKCVCVYKRASDTPAPLGGRLHRDAPEMESAGGRSVPKFKEKTPVSGSKGWQVLNWGFPLS